ncbi:MAG TPA: hypothetical protein ENJ40_03845 [Thermosulfurimonas dismutans]|uniref:Chemoreceptor glutamine deamidase CheD n=1 Tax=Thermosulfurimonas dismutans TaxID=999894 RepID=A0A7C3GEH8_9BACT|nr:hypothetical protein [Thermosulfurimonas dismutans]
MKPLLVEQGTFRITRSAEEVLYTKNLGACVAVGFLDQESGVAALVEYILPEKRGLKTPEGFPAFFAEEGLPLVVEEFKKQGGDPSRAKVVVAGGGRFKKSPRWLDIGSKNLAAARFFLRRLGILPLAEKTGLPFPQRMEVSLKGGIRVHTLDQVESW